MKVAELAIVLTNSHFPYCGKIKSSNLEGQTFYGAEFGENVKSEVDLSYHMYKVFVQFIFFQLDDDPFNPDFVEVDRVLDVSTCIDQVTGNVSITFYEQDGFSSY